MPKNILCILMLVIVGLLYLALGVLVLLFAPAIESQAHRSFIVLILLLVVLVYSARSIAGMYGLMSKKEKEIIA